MTLIGQPETILEVDGGAIYIDFGKALQTEEQLADEDLAVASTPLAANENNLFSTQGKDYIKNHPLNRGTPLTIKKSKVARIQVCEIRYNRTKASF